MQDKATAPATDAPLRAIGYARVSTDRQADSGLGLGAQQQAIVAACEQRGWDLVDQVHDVASGKSTNGRHALAHAIERIERGEAEALVVLRLDRLARSVVDGGSIINRAGKHGWDLVITDIGLDTSTPMGKFGAHILLAAAELERAMISERTKAARAEAIRQGRPVGGRPAGTTKVPPDVVERILAERQTGASLRAIADSLTRAGIPTATKRAPGRWSAESVRQVILNTERVYTPDGQEA